MKAYAIIFLFAFYSVECRKVVPINKNANIDFINMEMGNIGAPHNTRPTPAPVPSPVKPAAPAPTPAPAKPTAPAPTPAPVKPVAPAPVKPAAPTQAPTLITPKPVNPTPAAIPITTPGPGSVKQLINFYDSQGKASPIRPYTYSQAVKQG